MFYKLCVICTSPFYLVVYYIAHSTYISYIDWWQLMQACSTIHVPLLISLCFSSLVSVEFLQLVSFPPRNRVLCCWSWPLPWPAWCTCAKSEYICAQTTPKTEIIRKTQRYKSDFSVNSFSFASASFSSRYAAMLAPFSAIDLKNKII